MERSNTRTIRQVIDEFMRGTPLHRRMTERRLVEDWEEVMGKSVARATNRLYIRDGVLYVHLNSSVLRSELFMLSKEILRKLNERAGEKVVREIVLK